mmetsp:Transcript_65368/g.142477  ORF Transcript_65368/g.142477 Transcript_65368/m.142477 type:complete len:252 (+) Transcript_65368:124-879(+)
MGTNASRGARWSTSMAMLRSTPAALALPIGLPCASISRSGSRAPFDTTAWQCGLFSVSFTIRAAACVLPSSLPSLIREKSGCKAPSSTMSSASSGESESAARATAAWVRPSGLPWPSRATSGGKAPAVNIETCCSMPLLAMAAKAKAPIAWPKAWPSSSLPRLLTWAEDLRPSGTLPGCTRSMKRGMAPSETIWAVPISVQDILARAPAAIAMVRALAKRSRMMRTSGGTAPTVTMARQAFSPATVRACSV